jgi:ferredoxin-NADP reductase
MTQEAQKYVVRKKIAEAPGISTLELTFTDGGIPSFIPGQCITVYFPDSKTPEGKAYSISSAPLPNCPNSTVAELGQFGKTIAIAITVKAVGEFSNRLCAMEPGDEITASLPYGYFTNEHDDDDHDDDDKTLVMLAGGIGIAPFRSIILDAASNRPAKKMALFYSAKTLADLIFKKEFDTLAKSKQNFTAHYFVTREQNIPTEITNRRITAERILRSSPSIDNLDFMICGSISFNRDLRRDLRSAGIPEDHINTEAFFS